MVWKSVFAENLPKRRRRARPRIIKEAQNVWRSALAERVSFLIDAAAYYGCLERTLDRAEEQIWITGWDFDPRIKLRPDRPDAEALGTKLERLAAQKPNLKIRILIWAMGPIYSGKSLRLFRKQKWASHPQIELRFANHRALRGSHHQKLVSIDDRIAFVGGTDLTARRWDTPDHSAENNLRRDPDGNPYDPVHDIQVVLEGEASRAIGDLCRSRWKSSVGEKVGPPRSATVEWPADVVADLKNCQIAIARTEPGFGKKRGHQEALRLTLDALRSARRYIYIENQYFASRMVSKLLCKRLQEADGPEVVVITTRSSHGLLERLVMGENRDRLIRGLKQTDRYGRLRVAYPVVPKVDGTEQEVIIHSKVVVIDDRFLRVGSSNFNHRSEGFDTECDVAVEAASDEQAAAIAKIRNGLLAEHLDAEPSELESTLRKTGSLVAVVDTLNTRQRGLRPFDGIDGKGATALVWGTGFVDPQRPVRPFYRIRALLRRWSGQVLALLARLFAASVRRNSAIESETKPSGNGRKK
ncbi:phospholipase D-like domain-containing protein [Sinorhizobium numidicum]|uniref:Phospholipase D n=1 Tax=Sinorhizobium numidicum TaxID=680248 RepID=A0ABY8CMI9_9HYPH|nr:phospholipase D-like domain-containing protein [Sinorhizobium numidicum]WEX73893.1 phospholipase D-like domain-containing protein [Sinorhizobium numidicum]WEX79878.1 phospholipase D-like domain-containing protein [Sinorhizobium numidicum]